jgi:hypothetical protein
MGRYGDRLAAHKELQRLLSPQENLVGAAVRGHQSPAYGVLEEKDVRAVKEVLHTLKSFLVVTVFFFNFSKLVSLVCYAGIFM